MPLPTILLEETLSFPDLLSHSKSWPVRSNLISTDFILPCYKMDEMNIRSQDNITKYPRQFSIKKKTTSVLADLQQT